MDCKWEGCFNSNSDDLKEHIEAHFKAAKTHVCLWRDCTRYGESFSNKYAFMTHLRVHTGEKPYACKKCMKCFSRVDALAKHSKKHDSEYEQLCTDAQRFYSICQERKDSNSTIYEIIEERRIAMNILRILHDELLNEDASKEEVYWDRYINEA